jgi:hypothetical protein
MPALPDRRCGRIRAYRIFTIALFLLFIPLVFLVSVFLFKLLHTFIYGLILGGLWMVAYALTATLLALCRCPNCKRRFASTWLVNKKCAYCKFEC